MNSLTMRSRISALPACHTLLVIVLFLSGGLCLALDIITLSENICNCPVINKNFVPFWIHAGVSILQLSLALFMFIALIALACRPTRTAHPVYYRFIRDHVVSAVGPTGQFIPTYSGSHPPIIVDKEDNSTYLIRIDSRNNANSAFDCCARKCQALSCSRQCHCTTRIGWLQPITVILTIIFIGQTLTLIWFCQQRSEVTDPQKFFFSRVTNLFVEVKISHWLKTTALMEDPFQIDGTVVSRFLYPDGEYCWSLIQSVFHCCGPVRYTDWAMNSTINESAVDFVNTLPESCFCLQNTAGEPICGNPSVKSTSRGFVYTTGCLSPLSERLYRLYSIGIIVIPCSLVLHLLTFFCDLIYTIRTAQLILRLQEEEYRSEYKRASSSNNYS